ncbi:unnamed protein product [Effrenium voratum]|nr:unnamed protein product [Effrenium voratum]
MSLPTLLHAQPHDTKEELTSRYRRLAAQLHPDKNSSVGAHAAFIKLKEEFEEAVQYAPSLARQQRTQALDAKRTCHVRRKKGWSQNRSKGKQASQKLLAIEDAPFQKAKLPKGVA